MNADERIESFITESSERLLLRIMTGIKIGIALVFSAANGTFTDKAMTCVALLAMLFRHFIDVLFESHFWQNQSLLHPRTSAFQS